MILPYEGGNQKHIIITEEDLPGLMAGAVTAPTVIEVNGQEIVIDPIATPLPDLAMPEETEPVEDLGRDPRLPLPMSIKIWLYAGSGAVVYFLWLLRGVRPVSGKTRRPQGNQNQNPSYQYLDQPKIMPGTTSWAGVRLDNYGLPISKPDNFEKDYKKAVANGNITELGNYKPN